MPKPHNTPGANNRTHGTDSHGKKPSGDAPNLPPEQPETVSPVTNASDEPAPAAPDPEAAAPQPANQHQPPAEPAAAAAPPAAPVPAAPTPLRVRPREILSAVQFRDVMREQSTLPDGVVVTSGFDIHEVPVVGNTRIYDGDWILTDEQGNRRVVTDDVFNATFMPAAIGGDELIAAAPIAEALPHADPLEPGNAYVDLLGELGGAARVQVPERDARGFTVQVAGITYAHVSNAADGVWQYRKA